MILFPASCPGSPGLGRTGKHSWSTASFSSCLFLQLHCVSTLVFNAPQCPVHPETTIALSAVRHSQMGKIFTEVEPPPLKEPVEMHYLGKRVYVSCSKRNPCPLVLCHGPARRRQQEMYSNVLLYICFWQPAWVLTRVLTNLLKSHTCPFS